MIMCESVRLVANAVAYVPRKLALSSLPHLGVLSCASKRTINICLCLWNCHNTVGTTIFESQTTSKLASNSAMLTIVLPLKEVAVI